MNVIFLGKRVFVDALKELKMRPSWVIWGRGLNLVTSILVRVRRRKDRKAGDNVTTEAGIGMIQSRNIREC